MTRVHGPCLTGLIHGRIHGPWTRPVNTVHVYRPWLLQSIQSVITFRVSRRRREMYCGHVRLCVCLCVCVSVCACPHYCTDADETCGSGRRCPLVVHYWADLQMVHGLRCYDNITRTRNASEYMLALALCLVLWFFVSDIAVFGLKMDVKLQPTNQPCVFFGIRPL